MRPSGWGPQGGIGALSRRDQGALALSLCEDTEGRRLSIYQEGGSHQKPTMIAC